jgi:hypothetical protein
VDLLEAFMLNNLSACDYFDSKSPGVKLLSFCGKQRRSCRGVKPERDNALTVKDSGTPDIKDLSNLMGVDDNASRVGSASAGDVVLMLVLVPVLVLWLVLVLVLVYQANSAGASAGAGVLSTAGAGASTVLVLLVLVRC